MSENYREMLNVSEIVLVIVLVVLWRGYVVEDNSGNVNRYGSWLKVGILS